MSNPKEDVRDAQSPDVIAFIMNADKNALGKFTIFLMLFHIAVNIASPFFTVYELSILQFDYFTFTILACASVIASFLTMLFWGKYVDNIGARNVLVFCGFLIPLIPFFWTLTVNPYILFFVEAFSGIVWAGFNLSVSTYLFDATERKNRTRELAEYTLFIQVALFAGAMAGSSLLGIFDKANPQAYITIFIVSSILRLLVMILFYRMLKELRIVEVPVKGRLFKNFISIRPQHGVVYEPAIETVPEAGSLPQKTPQQIEEAVESYVIKKRGIKKESVIKRLEREEDSIDTQVYLKKMKK